MPSFIQLRHAKLGKVWFEGDAREGFLLEIERLGRIQKSNEGFFSVQKLLVNSRE